MIDNLSLKKGSVNTAIFLNEPILMIHSSVNLNHAIEVEDFQMENVKNVLISKNLILLGLVLNQNVIIIKFSYQQVNVRIAPMAYIKTQKINENARDLSVNPTKSMEVL